MSKQNGRSRVFVRADLARFLCGLVMFLCETHFRPSFRIDKNGAQRSASGAVFPASSWSIPMLQIKFLPFGAKLVHPSVKLPFGSSCVVSTSRTGSPYAVRRIARLREWLREKAPSRPNEAHALAAVGA